MSKDEALEQWIEAELLKHQHHRCQAGMAQTEHCAREAWHAAVKHTLSFVAGELRRWRDNPLPPPRRPSIRDATRLGNLAMAIEKMKP